MKGPFPSFHYPFLELVAVAPSAYVVLPPQVEWKIAKTKFDLKILLSLVSSSILVFVSLPPRDLCVHVR